MMSVEDIISSVGVFSTLWNFISTLGDNKMHMGGYNEYTRGCSVHWGYHEYTRGF